MIEELRCKCCGAPINRSRMICEYCGMQYKDDFQTIKIETYQNPIRVLQARTEISDLGMKALGAEDTSKMALRMLSRNLADSLAEMMELETEYDPRFMKHIITAKCRVIEPGYRF